MNCEHEHYLLFRFWCELMMLIIYCFVFVPTPPSGGTWRHVETYLNGSRGGFERSNMGGAKEGAPFCLGCIRLLIAYIEYNE